MNIELRPHTENLISKLKDFLNLMSLKNMNLIVLIQKNLKSRRKTLEKKELNYRR